MRGLILAATILGILASDDAAKAGPSTTPRELVSVDMATVSDEDNVVSRRLFAPL